MPELDGFELAAMIREHPRFQQDGDHLRLGGPPDRSRPAARLRDGRGRLRAGAGRAGDAARQGAGLRRSLSQDAAARAAERRARAARRERTAELEAQTPAARGERAAAHPGARRGQMGSWDWDSATGTITGTPACTASSASTRTFTPTPAAPHADPSRRLAEARRGDGPAVPGGAAHHIEFRIRRRDGKSAGASAAPPRR